MNINSLLHVITFDIWEIVRTENGGTAVQIIIKMVDHFGDMYSINS